MKFGKRILAIQAEHAAAWAGSYLDYKSLKRLLRKVKELKGRRELALSGGRDERPQEGYSSGEEVGEVECDMADAEEAFMLALEVQHSLSPFTDRWSSLPTPRYDPRGGVASP